jgi:hypothetical protein
MSSRIKMLGDILARIVYNINSNCLTWKRCRMMDLNGCTSSKDPVAPITPGTMICNCADIMTPKSKGDGGFISESDSILLKKICSANHVESTAKYLPRWEPISGGRGHRSSKKDKCSPTVDRRSPKVDRRSPKVDRRSPKVNKSSPKVDPQKLGKSNGYLFSSHNPLLNSEISIITF